MVGQIYFNSPGVAGAVLQTPLLLIHPFIESSFHSESWRHCLSQTVRAGELRFWENVDTSPFVRRQISGVTCHIFVCGQSGGASWWRIYYQRGLPRLVFNEHLPDCFPKINLGIKFPVNITHYMEGRGICYSQISEGIWAFF